ALQVAGNAVFTAKDRIDLGNRGNRFTGTVALNTTTTGATLRNEAAVTLAHSVVNGSAGLSVTAAGAISQTGAIKTGDIVSPSPASFDAGSAAILLNDAGNSLGNVSLTSTGGDPVAVTSNPDLTLGRVQLGSGTLALTAGAYLIGGGGQITQTGPGAITLSAYGIQLQGNNHLLGAVTVTNSGYVSVNTDGDLTFNAASVIHGTFWVSAGGT